MPASRGLLMVPKLGPCQLSKQSHATSIPSRVWPSDQLPQERKLKLRKPFAVRESQGEKGTVPVPGTEVEWPGQKLKHPQRVSFLG